MGERPSGPEEGRMNPDLITEMMEAVAYCGFTAIVSIIGAGVVMCVYCVGNWVRRKP
jgi:hypothetical protein